MADEKSAQGGVGSRPLDLAGDSPELIAFALLRYLAQLEQQDETIKLNRAWMLDAYAECLEAVAGKRQRAKSSAKAAPSKPPAAQSAPSKPPGSTGRKRG